MFDFGTIFQKMGATLSGIFIAVAGVFGSTPIDKDSSPESIPQVTAESKIELQEAGTSSLPIASLPPNADTPEEVAVLERTKNTPTTAAKSQAMIDAPNPFEGISREEGDPAEVARLDAILIPYKTPPFPVDSELGKLILSLRGSTGGKIKRSSPSNACVSGTNSASDDDSQLVLSRGLYFNVDVFTSYQPPEYRGEYFSIQMDAYDSKGGHVGLAPTTRPGWSYDHFPEERSLVWRRMNGGSGLTYVLEELDNARLVIKSKDYDTLLFRIQGEGNSCGIVDGISVLITPYTILTLPITSGGDIGPIQYDANGDGVSDVDISLVYEMSNEQISFIEKITKRLQDLKNR